MVQTKLAKPMSCSRSCVGTWVQVAQATGTILKTTITNWLATLGNGTFHPHFRRFNDAFAMECGAWFGHLRGIPCFISPFLSNHSCGCVATTRVIEVFSKFHFDMKGSSFSLLEQMMRSSLFGESSTGCGDPTCTNCGGDGSRLRQDLEKARGMANAHRCLREAKRDMGLASLSRLEKLRDAERFLREADNDNAAEELKSMLDAAKKIAVADLTTDVDAILLTSFKEVNLRKRGNSNRWIRTGTKVLKRIAQDRYFELAMERVATLRTETELKKDTNSEPEPTDKKANDASSEVAGHDEE